MLKPIAALAVIATLAGAPAAWAQAASCNWYADTSLKQQQQNEQRKCGFTGPEWSLNRQTHMSWCTTQMPDNWKAVAQKREQMLGGCKK